MSETNNRVGSNRQQEYDDERNFVADILKSLDDSADETKQQQQQQQCNNNDSSINSNGGSGVSHPSIAVVVASPTNNGGLLPNLGNVTTPSTSILAEPAVPELSPANIGVDVDPTLARTGSLNRIRGPKTVDRGFAGLTVDIEAEVDSVQGGGGGVATGSGQEGDDIATTAIDGGNNHHQIEEEPTPTGSSGVLTPQGSSKPYIPTCTNVFIAGIPPGWDEPRLTILCEPFGEILSIKLVLNRHYAFIMFKEPKAAHAAIASLHNMSTGPGGHGLHVALAMHDEGADEEAGDRLFVRGLPPWMTRDELRAMFTKFGNITECTVLYMSDGQCKGVAFVQFSELEMSVAAKNEMSGKKVDQWNFPMEIRFAETNAVRAVRQVRNRERMLKTGGTGTTPSHTPTHTSRQGTPMNNNPQGRSPSHAQMLQAATLAGMTNQQGGAGLPGPHMQVGWNGLGSAHMPPQLPPGGVVLPGGLQPSTTPPGAASGLYGLPSNSGIQQQQQRQVGNLSGAGGGPVTPQGGITQPQPGMVPFLPGSLPPGFIPQAGMGFPQGLPPPQGSGVVNGGQLAAVSPSTPQSSIGTPMGSQQQQQQQQPQQQQQQQHLPLGHQQQQFMAMPQQQQQQSLTPTGTPNNASSQQARALPIPGQQQPPLQHQLSPQQFQPAGFINISGQAPISMMQPTGFQGPAGVIGFPGQQQVPMQQQQLSATPGAVSVPTTPQGSHVAPPSPAGGNSTGLLPLAQQQQQQQVPINPVAGSGGFPATGDLLLHAAPLTVELTTQLVARFGIVEQIANVPSNGGMLVRMKDRGVHSQIATQLTGVVFSTGHVLQAALVQV